MLPESEEGVVDLVEGAIDGLVLCINKMKRLKKKEKKRKRKKKMNRKVRIKIIFLIF